MLKLCRSFTAYRANEGREFSALTKPCNLMPKAFWTHSKVIKDHHLTTKYTKNPQSNLYLKNHGNLVILLIMVHNQPLKHLNIYQSKNPLSKACCSIKLFNHSTFLHFLRFKNRVRTFNHSIIQLLIPQLSSLRHRGVSCLIRLSLSSHPD